MCWSLRLKLTWYENMHVYVIRMCSTLYQAGFRLCLINWCNILGVMRYVQRQSRIYTRCRCTVEETSYNGRTNMRSFSDWWCNAHPIFLIRHVFGVSDLKIAGNSDRSTWFSSISMIRSIYCVRWLVNPTTVSHPGVVRTHLTAKVDRYVVIIDTRIQNFT